MEAQGQKQSNCEDLFRLVRVARRLDEGGYYNEAKLFWAVAYSKAMNETQLEGLPISLEELDHEVEAGIGLLKEMGVNQDVIDAAVRGRKRVQEDSTIPWAEIPAVYVCRTCGEIAMAKPPQRCPVCGARALTFREFTPTYFLEPINARQAVLALISAADEIEHAVKGLSEEEMSKPRRPSGWTIRDVLRHLLIAQELLDARLKLMLSQSNPSVAGVAAWAIGTDTSTMTTQEVLDHYLASRKTSVSRLKGLATRDWWRPAQHQEFGQITLQQQVSYFAKHDYYHLPQIETVRRAIEANNG